MSSRGEDCELKLLSTCAAKDGAPDQQSTRSGVATAPLPAPRNDGLVQFIKLGGVVDQHLAAVLLGNAVEGAFDHTPAVRPGRGGQRKVGAPEHRIHADVLARLQPRRIEPPDEMALPPEELRRRVFVTLVMQALALELVVGELELVGGPRERGLREDDLQLRKTIENPREEE